MKDRIFTVFHGTSARSAVVFAAVFLFLACTAEDRFFEYRGVNLIADYALDAWVPDYNEAAAPAPAQTGGIYMRYESAGATGPGGAEAFLLRTNNLFPNGDFEATTAGAQPAGWAFSGASADYSVTDGTRTIAGKALRFDIDDENSLIYFPLDGLADGFIPAPASYTVRFAVKYQEGQQTLLFEINESTNELWKTTMSLTLPEFPAVSYAFPDDFITDVRDNSTYRPSTSNAMSFYINSVSPDPARGAKQGSIDNLRFVRSDLSYKIRLRLRREDTSPLPLPSGTYRLSVYVKQDPSAGSGNVMRSSGIALGINRNWDGVNFLGLQDAPGIPADPSWADWTLVSADFPSVQIDPPAADTDYNIELTISATDSASNSLRDAGSILISRPALEFLPD